MNLNQKDFNKQHYRELLIYAQDLKKRTGKLNEMPENKWYQLSKYSAMLWTQLAWEMKETYVDLMAQFLNGEISEGTFKIEVILLQKSQQEVFDTLEANLILLSPSSDPNWNNVGDLISDLDQVIEEFEIESMFSLKELQELAKQGKYSEVENQKRLRNYEVVKEIYSDLQTYLNN